MGSSSDRIPVFCNINTYYDPLLGKCLSRDACTAAGKYCQERLCLTSCGPDYRYYTGTHSGKLTKAVNECFYAKCPIWLGIGNYNATNSSCSDFT